MLTLPRAHTLALALVSSKLLFLATAGADQIDLGTGSYRSDLPPGEDGKPRRSIDAQPLISQNFDGPIPTNDWWSSLLWPMHSPHSMAMFPHPLAVRAHPGGLGIGYTATPTINDHRKDGVAFQTGSDYRFPFRQSLLVGLRGLEAEQTVVDRHSDWAVTALWKSAGDELRATFAHGSPFVYFERQSDLPVSIAFTAAKIDATREPVDPFSVEWSGITAKHNGKPGAIRLAINAGDSPGIGSKARLVYDFDGDGKTDRTETFELFATDPVDTSWEIYSSENKSLDPGLTRGEMRDFTDGSVRLEYWRCFGDGELNLKLAESTVQFPDGTSKTLGKEGLATVGAAEEGAGATKVFHRNDRMLGVSLNGSHFGIFAPDGAKLEIENDLLISDLAGKNYLSVAVLPDSKPATLEHFETFAFAFLRDTKIAYRYDPQSATVTTTFTAETQAMEGEGASTLFALYRHQHLHATEPDRFEDFSYASPRGEMRVLAGQSFATEIPFLGILPALPTAASDVGEISAELEREAASFRFTKDDTYWNGKEFGKVAELIQIADQLGTEDVRDQLLAKLQSRLEDWFDGKKKYFFRYDDRWDTITGYPDSYGSGEQLNDHHFHYSYFIRAAATIAQFDPGWVAPDRYGKMIDTLIRDCANYDRNDQRFPWMRNFDPYAGHSWAAGHAGFASGNNQESSSESMNFATSLILYGQATGNDEIRDLGIYWHSTEAEAIRHYWFDQDRAVFPDGFEHSCVGMVWGDGASYGTWWTANPEEIHGINFLPINGGSLYLGRDPEYILANLADLKASNRNFHQAGFPGDSESYDRWADILAEYLALADPQAAAAQTETIAESELGETKTHTRQWIGALGELGTFDSKVRSNHVTAVAFEKAYIVYNPTDKDLPVVFSDGKQLSAPPGLSTSKR